MYNDYLWQARDWIDAKSILELFSSVPDYQDFVDDYEQALRLRDVVKAAMADG